MKARTLIRVSIYLLVYLGIPIIGVSIANEGVRSVLVIVYIFLLVPAGFMLLIEFYRTNDGASLFARAFDQCSVCRLHCLALLVSRWEVRFSGG